MNTESDILCIIPALQHVSKLYEIISFELSLSLNDNQGKK